MIAHEGAHVAARTGPSLSRYHADLDSQFLRRHISGYKWRTCLTGPARVPELKTLLSLTQSTHIPTFIWVIFWADACQVAGTFSGNAS